MADEDWQQWWNTDCTVTEFNFGNIYNELERQYNEEFYRQLAMTEEEWQQWWDTEYDIAEINRKDNGT